MNVVCKYGRPAVPLSEHGNFRSDGAVNVSVASFGAIASMRDEYLPEDYQQADHLYRDFISPDRCIDASTCALPFNTWFIDGLGHSQKNEDYWKLVDAIVYEDLDVFSSSQWPQFLKVSDEDAERLIPVTETPEAEETLYDKIWNIFRTIVLLPKTIWNKISGR